MPAVSSYLAVAGMVIGGGTAVRGQQQAKSQARKAREAQEKELAEQRILDAAAQAAAEREEEDVAETEIGADLTVGTRSSQKREVRAAPTTGLRVG